MTTPNVDEIFADGRARERAAIVAWIRRSPERMKAAAKAGAVSIGPLYDAGQLNAATGLADAIERGEHLR
jgi:hypothetical protein